MLLVCNYTDVTSESGTVYRLADDLCHHVSSCFSFWGTDQPIRLTCSYNYFCSSSFSMPALSVMLSRCLDVDPSGLATGMPITGFFRGLGTISHSIQFSKSRPMNYKKPCDVISRFKLVSQVCCPDGLITQPTYHPNAMDYIWVLMCTMCKYFSAYKRFMSSVSSLALGQNLLM